jgi:hypothetical protein
MGNGIYVMQGMVVGKFISRETIDHPFFSGK